MTFNPLTMSAYDPYKHMPRTALPANRLAEHWGQRPSQRPCGPVKGADDPGQGELFAGRAEGPEPYPRSGFSSRAWAEGSASECEERELPLDLVACETADTPDSSALGAPAAMAVPDAVEQPANDGNSGFVGDDVVGGAGH